MMNKDKLKHLCHKKVNETNIDFSLIQSHYFFETILKRISLSDESKNFIFKGGFLLSNLVGIQQRNTVDMDISIKNFSLTEENIRLKFEKILNHESDDNISYEIKKITEIRKNDEYGGFKLLILCKLENIRHFVPIDVAVGDPITPLEISYQYKSVFEDKSYNIFSYNIETILAEKIQTIYQREFFNSRAKDFYDVYLLFSLKGKEIKLDVLKNALEKTFEYRKTHFNIEDIINKLTLLKEDDFLNKTWNNYVKNQDYIITKTDLDFNEVVETIKTLLEKTKNCHAKKLRLK